MTEITSKAIESQSNTEEPVKTENIKTEKNLFSKIISLMDENPNYKMLGALGMMLINFSVCVIVANWLKHSTLVS